jgi:hypothetical protein
MDKERKRFEGPIDPRQEKIHHTTDLTLNEYKNMQKQHLKAYLRGDTQFRYKGTWYPVEFKFSKDAEE